MNWLLLEVQLASLNFITHLISGLGQSYYPVAVYIEANVLKMSVNEAYSMLLTYEARLESAQSTASIEVKMNYMANVTQTGNNQKKTGNNANWNPNGQGNWTGNFVNRNNNGVWNGNFNNRGGYGGGFGLEEEDIMDKLPEISGMEIKEEEVSTVVSVITMVALLEVFWWSLRFW